MANHPRGTPSEASTQQPEPASPLRVAWRHKLLMVVGIVLGLSGGAAAYVLFPPVYQSAAQVLVVNKRPDTLMGVEARTFAFDDYVSMHQEVLKSALIVERAIQKRQLQGLSSFEKKKLEDLNELIRRSLVVNRSKGLEGKNNVLLLSFRAAVPDDCQTVLRALLESYKAFLDEKYKAISDETFAQVLQETNSLQKELEQKEAAYREFREQAPLLTKSRDGLDLRQERLNSIQAKRSALLLRRLELEGQLAALEDGLKQGRSREALLALAAEFAGKGEADDPRRDKAVTPQEQLLPLLLEEQKLLQQYGPKHPDVQAAQNRVQAARELLLRPPVAWGSKGNQGSDGDFLDLHLQIFRQKLEQVRIAEGLVVRLFEDEYAQAQKLARYEVQDESFRNGIALTKQLYEGLLKRLRDANLAKGSGGCEVEIIGPPEPGKKVAPSAVVFLPGAAFLGALMGLGLAYWADGKKQRFRSASERPWRPTPPVSQHHRTINSPQPR